MADEERTDYPSWAVPERSHTRPRDPQSAPGGYGAPGPYSAPGSEGAPGPYGAPGSYGAPGPYGPPGGYGAPGPYGAPGYGGYGAPGTNPYGPPGYGYGYGYQPTETDKGARTSLILSIVGLVLCGIIFGPAAIVEGVKARKRIRESNGRLTGDGMALAGIIIGVLATIGAVYFMTRIFATPPSAPRSTTVTTRLR